MIHRVQGSVELPLKEVIQNKRLKNTYQLQGVKHGQLALDFQWLGILDAS